MSGLVACLLYRAVPVVGFFIAACRPGAGGMGPIECDQNFTIELFFFFVSKTFFVCFVLNGYDADCSTR